MHITCSGNGPLHSSEGYTEMILYMLHKGIISLQYPSSPVLYIKLYVTLSISLYLSISHTHTHTHTHPLSLTHTHTHAHTHLFLTTSHCGCQALLSPRLLAAISVWLAGLNLCPAFNSL